MSANFHGMTNTRRTFALGFKILVAAKSIYCGRVYDVAKELNISTSTLHHWKKLYQEGEFTLKKTSAEISYKMNCGSCGSRSKS